MSLARKTTKRFSPAQLLVVGFLAIIALGTVLLCLPISSKSREFTPIFDSLFTATSAACVNGLTLYDTYLHWSLFGQIVIALLIQVGGLGFVTIITFFNVAAGKKLGYHAMKSAAGDLSQNSFEDGRKILIRIIRYSGAFELAGAVILCAVLIPEYGIYGLWMGIFLSISAFCNAGFDLLGMEGAGSSVISQNGDPVLMITLALLVIFGGLGFIVWENLFNIRTRKKLTLHTKSVLIMTGALLVLGTVFFLISEYDNPETLGKMPLWQKLLNAFFCSVSTRTAGFDSVGFGEMSEFSQLGAILLMFVGAAPGSTGGGIKVTTLLVTIAAVASYIRNKNDVELFGHKLDKLTIYRTLVIAVLSMVAVTGCFAVIYFSMPVTEQVRRDGTVRCLFEAVAVFSTTGLTAGATAQSGVFGLWTLMLTMFVGRIGPVSLIMSLVLNKNKRKNIVLPDGQIFIG